jgi:hypothetical protein
MLSAAMMASSASSAEEDLAYLQKTMPLAAMRSTLQYSRSLKRAISAYACRGRRHIDLSRALSLHTALASCWLTLIRSLTASHTAKVAAMQREHAINACKYVINACRLQKHVWSICDARRCDKAGLQEQQ